MTDDGWRLGHRPGLDGLRGVAIGLVLLLHWWPGEFPGGDTGVDLFFVLSGFLITRLIVEEIWTTRKLSLRSFYLRRFRRLMPAAMTVVLACVATSGAIFVVLYSANWARISGVLVGGPLEHTWSLAIEEQFYALWPLVLLAVIRFRHSWLIVAGMIVVVGVHRVSMDAGWLRIVAGTDTRVDTLLVGCMTALAVGHLSRLKTWSWFAAGLIPAIVVLVLDPPWLLGWGYTVVALMWAVVLMWAVGATGWLTWKPLRTLGVLSYSLYLWHVPITWLLRGGDMHNTAWQSTLLAIALSFGAAALSYRCIEQRFRVPSPARTGSAARLADMVGKPAV